MMNILHRKVKAVVFDLDGTLLDTLDDLADATNYALRQNGMPERTVEEVRMFVGNGVKRLIERAVADGTGRDVFERTFADFKAYYIRHCQDKTRLYDGIMEMLHTLHGRGLKLAIVSNKLQAGVDELHELYFKDTVEVAIGEREGISRKPAPDMVETALKALGVRASEAVYIGDSDVDLATAANSGLPCISVLWGFRDRAFLETHGATTFAESPAEVCAIVG
ncbi:MAG: HAD family hydrolase [Bacteroidaceae bacterium]|nr:HAD family hydrolase [Bacteroidaceae bacterium]